MGGLQMKALRFTLAALFLTPLIARGQDLCLPTVMVSYPVFYYPVCEAPVLYCAPLFSSSVAVPPCPSIQAPPTATPPRPSVRESPPKSPGLAPPTAAPPSERPKSQTSLSPPSDGLSKLDSAYDVFP